MVAGTKGVSPRRPRLATGHLPPHPSPSAGECGAPLTPGRGGHRCRHGHVVTASPLHHSGGARGSSDPAGGPSPSLSGGGSHVYGAGGLREAGRTWSSAWRGRCSRRAGIRVCNVRYVASQPGLPHSLMMGFVADYQAGGSRCKTTNWWPPVFFEADRLPRYCLPRHHAARRLIEAGASQRRDEGGGAKARALVCAPHLCTPATLRCVCAAPLHQSGIISAIYAG